PAVATPQALAVLYPDDPEKIAQILRARAEAGANDLAGPILPAPGHAFTIEAEIARRGRTYRRCAVIELTGDAQRPFFALAWQ
ncbi:MAG: hypothetical protein JO261_09180, partial [Alphaproteobacteria bacterium]|nr:hypothetical protein [Alphaproteobacteria bacterium]